MTKNGYPRSPRRGSENRRVRGAVLRGFYLWFKTTPLVARFPCRKSGQKGEKWSFFAVSLWWPRFLEDRGVVLGLWS